MGKRIYLIKISPKLKNQPKSIVFIADCLEDIKKHMNNKKIEKEHYLVKLIREISVDEKISSDYLMFNFLERGKYNEF